MMTRVSPYTWLGRVPMLRIALILGATLGSVHTAGAQQAGRRTADTSAYARPKAGKVSATPATTRTAPDVRITNSADATVQTAPATRNLGGNETTKAKKAPAVRTTMDSSAAASKPGAAAKSSAPRKPPQ